MNSVKPATLLFDLSEVFISGLYGVGEPVAELVGRPAAAVKQTLNEGFHDLLCGRITEREYLSDAMARGGWQVQVEDLMSIIRRNFHREVPGMIDLLPRLKPHCRLALLSDHAAEWVAYIEAHFDFLQHFDPRFYSFQLGRTKAHPETFERVLELLGSAPQACLFIDDNPANIAVAASVGLPGIHFESVRQLTTALAEWGFGL